MIPKTISSEWYSGDKLWTSDILYLPGCDLFIMSVVLSSEDTYQRWCIKCTKTELEPSMKHAHCPFHLKLCRHLELPHQKLLHGHRHCTFSVGNPRLVPPTEIRVYKRPVIVPYHLFSSDCTPYKNFLSGMSTWYCGPHQKITSTSTINRKQWSDILHVQYCLPVSAPPVCSNIACLSEQLVLAEINT